jgi:hypothetical protein
MGISAIDIGKMLPAGFVSYHIQGLRPRNNAPKNIKIRQQKEIIQ